MRTTLGVALLSALLCPGLQAAAPAAAPAPSPAAVTTAAPADDDLDAVLWTQRAAEHDLVLEEIYRAAREALPAALADPTWDALPQGE